MNDWQVKVRQFHERFGCVIGDTPGLRDTGLRTDLIWEEVKETFDGVEDKSLPDAVDGLVDLIYVCLGAAVAWGVDLAPMFEAVHEANMAKVGGGTRSDGKIQKPPGWVAPNIEGELMKQGWNG